MSINECTLAGRITSDVSLNYTTSNGIPVLSFLLAVKQKTYRGGEKTVSFRVTVWRELAIEVSETISKNDFVLINGRLKAEEFTDKKGKVRKLTEIDAKSVTRFTYPNVYYHNECYVSGTIDQVLELQTTRHGQPMLAFALTSSFPSKRGTRKEIYRVIAWNEMAELLHNNFVKGNQIIIKGNLGTNTWLDENDEKRTTVVIVATEFLSSSISEIEEPISASAEETTYIEHDELLNGWFEDE